MGYTLTLSLIDGQGRDTTHKLELPNAITTVAAAQTTLDAIVADWPGISGLGITAAHLALPMTVTVTTAESHSNFDEGAQIKLQMVDGGKFSYRIPAPLRDATDGQFVYITGGAVDVGDAGVIAWFANFLSAGGLRITKYGQRIMATGGILSGKLEKA